MAKSRPVRPKRFPQRTCVACRQVQDKRSMIRIVNSARGILVDPTSKLSGRGAYLHADKDCWAVGLGLSPTGKPRRRNPPIEQALKAKLTPTEKEYLQKYWECLDAASPIQKLGRDETPGTEAV